MSQPAMQVQPYHPPAYSGFEDPLMDVSIQSQDVFQAQSTDQFHQRHNDNLHFLPKHQHNFSSVSHIDMQQNAVKTYGSGSADSQCTGLTAFGVEKPEEYIKTELDRLYNALGRAERYQKYREKQPVLTPAEVMERDATDRQEKKRREAEGVSQSHKDNTIWPDFMEYAFWRALVRWPPIGRKKYILEGVLKGRNELVQESIYRDTGITRDRKQISSHLQVLKGQLKGVPIALAYMGTMEEFAKRRRRHGSVAFQPRHSPALSGPQHTHGTVPATKNGCLVSPHIWPQSECPNLGLALDTGSHALCPSHEALSTYENFSAPLSPDGFASMPLNLNQLNASIPISGSDYSEGGSTLSLTEDVLPSAYDNGLEIGCGNIPDSSPSQPTLSSPAYEGFTDGNVNLEDLQELSNFENQKWAGTRVVMAEDPLVSMMVATNVHNTSPVACYSTKPNWQHANLISHLEKAAEQYQPCMGGVKQDQVSQVQEMFAEDDFHVQGSQFKGSAGRSFHDIQTDGNHLMWASQGMHQSFQGGLRFNRDMGR